MDFKEIGRKIALLRKEQGISQLQLASDLHLSRATVSSLENGNGIDIGLKKVLAILDYLGYEMILKEKSKFPSFEELLSE